MSLCECWKHWEHSGDLSSSEPQVGHYGFVIDNYGDFEIGWFVGLEGFDFVFGSGDLIATVRSSTEDHGPGLGLREDSVQGFGGRLVETPVVAADNLEPFAVDVASYGFALGTRRHTDDDEDS